MCVRISFWLFSMGVQSVMMCMCVCLANGECLSVFMQYFVEKNQFVMTNELHALQKHLIQCVHYLFVHFFPHTFWFWIPNPSGFGTVAEHESVFSFCTLYFVFVKQTSTIESKQLNCFWYIQYSARPPSPPKSQTHTQTFYLSLTHSLTRWSFLCSLE